MAGKTSKNHFFTILFSILLLCVAIFITRYVLFQPLVYKSFYYIVADVGGTYTRFEFFHVGKTISNDIGISSTFKKDIFNNDKEKLIPSLLREKIFISADYNEFPFLDFLDVIKEEFPYPTFACLAVAGPVSNNSAKLTNLNWNINGYDLTEKFGFHVKVLNDFEAVGYGILALNLSSSADVVSLTQTHDLPLRVSQVGQNYACIGPGTGLGEMFVTFSKQGTPTIHPTEGSHADFAARTVEEWELVQYAKEKLSLPRLSVERLVAGSALSLIYSFLASRNSNLVNETHNSQLSRFESESSMLITKLGLSKEDRLCEMTLELFVSMVAAEAGNLALKTLPKGGVFIAGGMVSSILPLLSDYDKFYQHFASKGRMQNLLSTIPLYCVTHRNVGLLGASEYALKYIIGVEVL